MRRVWAAVILFAAVILLCVSGSVYTAYAAQTLLEQTTAIRQFVYEENYENAQELAEEAERQWIFRSRIFCGYVSHAQLETADKELASLKVSLEAEQQTYALKHCGQLEVFCAHLRRMDLPLPENIL